MSEAKFTKGEWGLYAIDRDMRVIGGVHIVAFDQYPCAFIPSWSDSKETEIEAIANAHLIAAAPEMYHEIEQDISWLEQMKLKFVLGSYEYRSICLRIESKKKLLAKARGEA